MVQQWSGDKLCQKGGKGGRPYFQQGEHWNASQREKKEMVKIVYYYAKKKEKAAATFAIRRGQGRKGGDWEASAKFPGQKPSREGAPSSHFTTKLRRWEDTIVREQE